MSGGGDGGAAGVLAVVEGGVGGTRQDAPVSAADHVRGRGIGNYRAVAKNLPGRLASNPWPRPAEDPVVSPAG